MIHGNNFVLKSDGDKNRDRTKNKLCRINYKPGQFAQKDARKHFWQNKMHLYSIYIHIIFSTLGMMDALKVLGLPALCFYLL